MNHTALVRFRRRTTSIASITLITVALGAPALAQDSQQQYEADWARIKAQCHLDPNLAENDWEKEGRPCPQSTPAPILLTGDAAVDLGTALGKLLAQPIIEALFGPSQPQVNPAIAQAHALNDQGVAAFQTQHYAEAASYFQQALQMTPDDNVIKNNLSDAKAHLTRQAINRSLNALDLPAAASGNSAQSAAPIAPGLGGFAQAGTQSSVSGLGFEASAAPKTASDSAGGLSFDDGSSGTARGSSVLSQLRTAALQSKNAACEFTGDTIKGNCDNDPGPMIPATPGTIPVPRAAAVFVDGIPPNVRVNPLVAPLIKTYEIRAHTEGVDQAAFVKAAQTAEENPQDQQAQVQAQSDAGKINNDKKVTTAAQGKVCLAIGQFGGVR